MPLFYKTTNNGKFVINTYGDYDQKKKIPLIIMHEQSEEKKIHTHTETKLKQQAGKYMFEELDFWIFRVKAQISQIVF